MKQIPTFVWFIVPTLILVIVGVWFFSRNPNLGAKDEDLGGKAPVSQPVEGTVEYDIVGRNHIAQGTAGSGYNSNPPSSGPHWPSPVKNGIYDSSLPDEQLIHNLEHGHVWIAYKPCEPGLQSSQASPDAGLKPCAPDEVKAKLKEIVEKDDWKVVLEPRDKNETMIALVSWGRVLKMDQFDEAKVKDFIKTYRNRGPENTPD